MSHSQSAPWPHLRSSSASRNAPCASARARRSPRRRCRWRWVARGSGIGLPWGLGHWGTALAAWDVGTHLHRPAPDHLHPPTIVARCSICWPPLGCTREHPALGCLPERGTASAPSGCALPPRIAVSRKDEASDPPPPPRAARMPHARPVLNPRAPCLCTARPIAAPDSRRTCARARLPLLRYVLSATAHTGTARAVRGYALPREASSADTAMLAMSSGAAALATSHHGPASPNLSPSNHRYRRDRCLGQPARPGSKPSRSHTDPPTSINSRRPRFPSIPHHQAEPRPRELPHTHSGVQRIAPNSTEQSRATRPRHYELLVHEQTAGAGRR